MRTTSYNPWFRAAGLVLGLLQFISLGYGQDQAQNQDLRYRFTLDAGNRVEHGFKGSRDLYRSQLDYGEGPKLFRVNLELSAPQGTNSFFDRMQLRLNDWGGEPHTSASFRMSKSGAYELKLDYQNVQYFSSIPRLANPFFEQGNLQSQHIFDIGPRYSRLEIRFRPGKAITPFIGWDRTDRRGPVRTTLSAGGVDEFVIGSLYDTYSNDIRGGVNFNVSSFNLMLEQGLRIYREKTDYSTSATQPGNSLRPILGRDVFLNNYSGDVDSSTKIPFSNAVAVWRPWEQLSLRANMAYSMATLEPFLSDSMTGNFFSFAQSAFFRGQNQQIFGQVKRPSFYGDFSAELAPFSRFRVIESVKTHNFHVSGSALSNLVYLQFEPVLETGIRDQFSQLTELGSFMSFDNLTQELQGMFYVTPRLIARLGHRFERREMAVEQKLRFDRNVLITGLSYDFNMRNRISAEYEYGTTDQPILRTDVVDFHRARLRGRFSPFEKLEISGNATLFETDNDIPDLDFTSLQRDYGLEFTYAVTPRVSLSGGWERSRLDTNIFYVIPQTLRLDQFLYNEEGNFGHALLSLGLIRNATLTLGYSGWATTGDFPIGYHRPVARLEVPVHERVAFYGQWNYYEYNEKVRFLPQDYLTNLATFGFRVSVDKP